MHFVLSDGRSDRRKAGGLIEKNGRLHRAIDYFGVLTAVAGGEMAMQKPICRK
jgi:hypothetical protein